jgi:hypothetical protein
MDAITGQGITNEKLDQILSQLALVIVDGAIQTIDIVHQKIHEGKHYTVTFATTINAAQNADVLIVTPDEPHLHSIAGIFADNSGTVFFYENTVTSNNGTPLNINNNNRNSSNISSANAFHTPTVTNAGDILQGGLLGGSSPSLKIGGSEAQRFEWELKSNTKNLFRFTANNNSTLVIWNIFFYEKE